jgi:two-component system, NarL family, response regulator DevR
VNATLLTHPSARIAEVMEPPLNPNHLMDTSIGMQKPIRVVLIDDSILVLHGIKAFLSTSSRINIHIVGMATTGAEALAAIQTCRPDVVVMEVRVGQASGIDLCRAIRESHPNVGVLFFTAHDDKDLLRAAILAGAQGYLLKTAAAEAVAKSIEIVATGEAIMDQQVTQQVIMWVRDSSQAAQGNAKDGCSKEDLRLLSFVASGKTNKEIAQELSIAPRVVTTRLHRIYKRLRIARRSEAASYYIQQEKGSVGNANRSQ